MKKEPYLWALLIIAIAAVSVYFRYVYSPSLAISVRLGGHQSSIYEFNSTVIPVVVSNLGGSQIRNMSIGMFVNGTLSGVYRVSVPGHGEAEFNFTYVGKYPGLYNITAVADPGRLYNIGDRNLTHDGFDLQVLRIDNASPSELMPGDPIAYNESDMSALGYAVSSYLYENYSEGGFSLTRIKNLNSLLYPMLNLSLPYLNSIKAVSAVYSNQTLASVWLSGFIKPSIVADAAIGKGANVVNETVGNMSIAYASLGKNLTLCSWYSGGWTKSLAAEGSTTCNEIVGMKFSHGASDFAFNFTGINAIDTGTIGNFTSVSAGSYDYGRLFVSNKSIIFASVGNKGVVNDSGCYGVLDSFNGINYCSSYVLDKSGSISNLSLVRTTEYVKGLNVSASALVNVSMVLDQASKNIGILLALGFGGQSLNFTPEVRNVCVIKGFACSNAIFDNGTISFSLRSQSNQTIKLDSISCYEAGQANVSRLSGVILGGEVANVSASCYNYGTRLTGLLAGLNLHLALNYTEGGANIETNGTATIV